MEEGERETEAGGRLKFNLRDKDVQLLSVRVTDSWIRDCTQTHTVC